jgi:polysaccharide biosynthesis/export protein
MRKLIAAIFLIPLLASICQADSESLLISAGDLISVEVFDTPEMSQEVRVSDAGTVRLELIGDVKLAGKTPATAAQIIEKALTDKQIMRQPQVSVRVEEYASQNVSVIGQVRSPGGYPISSPQSVLTVLSLAGGLTEVADRNITIEHHETSEQVRYYLANDASQALSASDETKVYPGDTVVVPKAAIIYIMGDVARPGGYPITTSNSRLTVLQAIAIAGSANKTAVESRVRLIRKTEQGQQELIVHLAEVQKGKQPDIVLQADDILYVPFSWVKNVAVSASSIAASTSGAAIYTVR